MTHDVARLRKMLRRRRFQPAAAFTLIEMLVVIGILVIIVGIALPALNVARRSAKRTQISSQLAMIETAFVAYEQDFKGLPVLIEGDNQTGWKVYDGFGMLGAIMVGPGGAALKPSP